MNKSLIWELVKINILYSNPQLLASVKKKQNKNKDGRFSAYRSILIQQGFLILMMAILYSVFFLGIDYKRSTGFFSLQLAQFAILATVYGFTGFFSVFYDSKDTKLYLPLPLKASEVFIAKFLSAQGMVLPFLIPCLSLLIITYWQIGGPAFALFALPSFILLWFLVNLLNMIFMHFIGEILTKSPHKTTISTILLTGSSLVSMGALMFLQSQQTVSLQSDGFVQFPELPLFVGFHYIISQPISLGTVINLILPIFFMLGLVHFAFKTVIPNYFQQVLAIDTASSKRKVGKPRKLPQNLNQALIKHHLSTLNDSNLMVQTFLQSLVMGVALLPSISKITEGGRLGVLSWEYFGIALLAGFLLGSMFAGSTTFIGTAMSLEKENYHFIRTLPINFKQFIIQKFWVIAAVQFLVPTLLYLMLALFVMKVNMILALFFGLGILVSALLTGQIYYWRDQRLLMLNWQNSNQLFGRGAGQWLIAGSIILTMILGAILLVISSIMAGIIGPTLVSSGLATLIVVLSGLLQLFLYKSYWQKL
ncbi:permease [Streptococcus suis]|uniref:permease n=1 Tax=Streptococcus suis TaxID=1307 RepID=UPI000CF4B7CC|nr:permease [Streptococcus suis]